MGSTSFVPRLSAQTKKQQKGGWSPGDKTKGTEFHFLMMSFRDLRDDVIFNDVIS